MAELVRVGDLAGGSIQNTSGFTATLNGTRIAVHGDAVNSHSPCPNPSSHCSATMIASGVTATLNGVRILVEGDLATCGHAAVASSTADIS